MLTTNSRARVIVKLEINIIDNFRGDMIISEVHEQAEIGAAEIS